MSNVLDKILSRNYEQLTISDLFLIDKYQKHFGLDKQFSQVLTKNNLNKKDETNLNDVNEDVKNEIIEVLKKELLPRTIILENLAKVDLEKEGIVSNFNSKFVESLRKLDNLKLCKLIDRISYYMLKNSKLNFFGRKSNGDGAYHEFNKVISDSLGLSLVFQIFGKKYLNRYTHLPIDKFNKEAFIEALSKYCVRYTYILEIIVNTMATFDLELLEGKKGSFKIGKEIKTYLDIVVEDTAKSFVRGEPNSNYYTEDVDGDDDE